MSGDALPLSSLRPDLDRGWPSGARWLDAGEDGAVLEQPPGSVVVFRLTSDSRAVRLRGAIELAGEEPGRGTLGVRATLAPLVGGGEHIWHGRIRRVGGRAFPRRLEVDLTGTVEGECELRLEVGTGPASPVHWHDLRLEAGNRGEAGIPKMAPGPSPNRPPATRTDAPLFSILTPVHNPPPDVLAETIDSVRTQTYTDWELCLVDDGSTDPEVAAALERAVAEDPRIHLRRREQAGGISVATNTALEMARGEFIALLDHDDVLVPEALATVVESLAEAPDTDMLYSDEELLADDGPNHVFAKPHWSPDLLRSQMYTCHLGVYRRSIAEEIGGFRSGFDGSQDFDFALRFTESTPRVLHIPRILYRWRVHAGSSAGSAQAKPAAYPAGRRALAEHLERTDTRGEVFFGPWQGIYRVVHELPSGSRVGVIAGASSAPRLTAAVADPARSGVQRVEFLPTASWADASTVAKDVDVLVLAAGDVEPLTHGWLSRLAAFALQPGVIAVGARTLAPDGRVEDGALTIEGGLPIPVLLTAAASDPGPLGIGLLPANAAAVAGVVAIPTEALEALGGLDPDLGVLAVPDLCLRAASTGAGRVVSVPDVLVGRLGPGPVNDLDRLLAFRRQWAAEYAADPYLDQAASWAPLAGRG